MNIIRDTSSHPPPELAFPAAGGTYDDPAFGCRVRRLTDERDSAGINSHGYSYYSPWSCDCRYLILGINGTPWLYSFDTVTGEATKLRPLFQGATDFKDADIEWTSIFWDRLNPTVCYAVERGDTTGRARIWRINVAMTGARQFSQLRRFTTEQPGCSIWQHSSSESGKVWAFHTKHTDGTVTANVWDVFNPPPDEKGNLRGTVLTYNGPAPATVNECQISPCGNVLRVCFNDESTALWYWREGRTVVIPKDDLYVGIVEHIDWTREWMVSGRKLDNAVVLRRLEDPLGLIRTILSLGWKNAHHAVLHRDFAIVSTYVGDRTWAAFECEIIQVFFDGRFRRLAHTLSLGVGGSLTEVGAYSPGAAYWHQPRAAVSPDGRWVIWTTDGMGTGRTDVFCVAVPPADGILAVEDQILAIEAEVEELHKEADGLTAGLMSATNDLAAARAAAADLRERLSSAAEHGRALIALAGP